MKLTYRALQINGLHRHNQNLVETLYVGTLHGMSLPWSTDKKTAVILCPDN
ncbi:MAG: hypothetical protein MGU50_25600 [Trichodesmium sp. MAG_R02]|nr:hypothetical protein [Trichodesmium sp. MAG_R02]